MPIIVTLNLPFCQVESNIRFMSAESERIVKQEITHHTLQDGSTRAVLISQKNNGKEHVLIIDTTKGRPLRVINGAFRLKIVTTKAVESKS